MLCEKAGNGPGDQGLGTNTYGVFSLLVSIAISGDFIGRSKMSF